MTDREDFDDAALTRLFEDARATAPQPGADLIARILADAEAQTPPAAMPAPVSVPRRRRPFAALLDAVGGWPGLAGMASAAVAGLWIGFAQPGPVGTLQDDMLGGASYDYSALNLGLADLLAEG